MESASAPVLLDISRLIWRARRPAPSGIDRVELAYAQHLLGVDAQRPAYAVVHLWGRLFWVSADGARRFVKTAAARWQEGTIEGRSTPTGVFALYATLVFSRWRAGFELRRQLKKHSQLPIFLLVSHHHLSRGHTIKSIRRRFEAHCVCLLHDLIPLDYPEYFRPRFARGHRRSAETIADQFDAVVVNSQVTADSFRRFLASRLDQPASAPKVHVAPPGVTALPRSPNEAQAAVSVPYFVVLGTIEPRKNHLLLLNLWSRLATTMAAAPRLLVIGARGWENEQVVDMLERSSRLHGLVEEHGRLSDLGIAPLLGRACAVLAPSFAEGFGLPLAEALASGVPVICSDIPVFREVGGDVPDYIDPLDLMAWRAEIIDYCRPDSGRRAAQMQRLVHWQPPKWSDHFRIVEGVLDEISESGRLRTN